MTRRFVIAQIKHETNTFSPVPTPLASFGHGHGPLLGRDALALAGSASPFAAFLDLAREFDAEAVTPIAAESWPSNRATRDTFETLVRPVLDAVAAGCDAVMLDLHGAMVVDGFDDAEGELLTRIRAIDPRVPIAVTLDYHTNLSPAMAESATIITGYKTYPHVDMYEAGQLAARILGRLLRGEVNPVMAWGWLPLLASVMRHDPDHGPSRTIVGLARAAERDGRVLAATWLPSFPHADTPFTGCSAVVITDGDPEAARLLRDEMLEIAWSRRDEFVFRAPALAESIALARDLGSALDARRAGAGDAPAPAAQDLGRGVLSAAAPLGPIVLLDHCDNCGSGGAQDDMTVIAAVLEAGLDEVAIAPLRDPRAVAAMVAAGVGATVELDLGGHTAMPDIGATGRPVRVRGTVRTITDGEIVFRGAMYTGIRSHLGRTAVLDTGRARIVVTERPHEPFDPVVFTHCGIDPRDCRFVLLKSRIHYRAGFRPLASNLVECSGRGVTSADLSIYPYRKLARPIFPLDPVPDPRPSAVASR